jgi:hypothetical protein
MEQLVPSNILSLISHLAELQNVSHAQALRNALLNDLARLCELEIENAYRYTPDTINIKKC